MIGTRDYLASGESANQAPLSILHHQNHLEGEETFLALLNRLHIVRPEYKDQL